MNPNYTPKRAKTQAIAGFLGMLSFPIMLLIPQSVFGDNVLMPVLIVLGGSIGGAVLFTDAIYNPEIH